MTGAILSPNKLRNITAEHYACTSQICRCIFFHSILSKGHKLSFACYLLSKRLYFRERKRVEKDRAVFVSIVVHIFWGRASAYSGLYTEGFIELFTLNFSDYLFTQKLPTQWAYGPWFMPTNDVSTVYRGLELPMGQDTLSKFLGLGWGKASLFDVTVCVTDYTLMLLRFRAGYSDTSIWCFEHG